MAVLPRNDALTTNPPGGASNLSVGGSDWMWAAMSVYCLVFVAYIGLSFKPRNGERIFHYLYGIALLVGAISYFAIASDLGWSVVKTELYRSDAVSYQIFFVKYVNWVVAWPVAILALGLMSGVSWATMVYNICLSWIWVITYLCGAYTTTSYKWGFFVFGTVAYFLLAYQTMLVGLVSARRVALSRDYLILAGWLNTLWLLYPIAWAVADGGNVISVTRSFIYFGILDVLMIPGLACCTLVLARNWDYGRLNLHFTQYGRVQSGEGVFPEKQRAPEPAPAPAEAVTAV